MGYTSTLVGGQPVVLASGISYSGASVTADRTDTDFHQLQAHGWTVVADGKGTEEERPAFDERGQQIAAGFRFFDTGLNMIVVRTSGGAWVDPVTGEPGQIITADTAQSA